MTVGLYEIKRKILLRVIGWTILEFSKSRVLEKFLENTASCSGLAAAASIVATSALTGVVMVFRLVEPLTLSRSAAGLWRRPKQDLTDRRIALPFRLATLSHDGVSSCCA